MKTELTRAVPRLKRLLPTFRKIRIAVVGDLMLDRYLWGTADRLSPEAAVPVVDFVSQNDCLGGAGNVASNLAALGAHVQAFGVVGGITLASKKTGDDEAGAALRACLRKAGIDDRAVLADMQRITTVKTRVIARHQQIVRIDHERRDALDAESEEKIFRALVASLKKMDGLVLSDYDKGLITDEFAERVLHACDKFRVPVFVKPKKSRPIGVSRRSRGCVQCRRSGFLRYAIARRREVCGRGGARVAGALRKRGRGDYARQKRHESF